MRSSSHLNAMMRTYAETQTKLSGEVSALGERTMTFSELLENIVSPSAKIRGAPVALPETILFCDGHPKCVLRYDQKENEARRTNSRAALQLPSLMKFMMSEYRMRKRGNERTSGFLLDSSSPAKVPMRRPQSW